ncbi:MAG: hypothetical protein KA362_06760, partial [Chloroflexi bacterium]|nr:hypothetical protein [Chloroflexota bacterium]
KTKNLALTRLVERKMFRLLLSSTIVQILLDSNAVFSKITLFGGTFLEKTEEERNYSAAKLSPFRKRFLKTALLSLM